MRRKQKLVKFFYRELLRLQEYKFAVMIYHNGKAIGCGVASKVKIIEPEAFGPGGYRQIDIDIPILYTDRDIITFTNEMYESLNDQHLYIRVAEDEDIGT